MKKIYLLSVLTVLFGFFVFTIPGPEETKAQTASVTVQCGTDAFTNMLGISSGQVLSGNFLLRANAYTSMANANVVKLEFKAQGNGMLAAGAQTTSGGPYWQASWNTASLPNGVYQIFAHAYFDRYAVSMGDCLSQPFTVSINNQTTSGSGDTSTATSSTESLSIETSHKYWEGPTNVWMKFSAKAFWKNSAGEVITVTDNATYEWVTTLGTITPAFTSATFKSGSSTGVGYIRVKAQYNGKTAEATINVKVINSTSTTYPSSTTDNSSTITSTPADTSTTSSATNNNVEIDPNLSVCLKAAVTEARYQEFIFGKAKPTSEELAKAWVCFEQTKYVLPSNWAPVKPEEVRNLPKDTSIKIKKMTNITTRAASGKEEKAILISGSSQPNKKLLIYVFSEPLVLATQTDKDGNWSYQLENPLEPGSHEIYVAMDRGDNTYVTSEPIVFDIARAESSETNPQGASLILAGDQPAYGSYNYLWYAGGLVLVALGFGFLVIRYRKSLKPRLANVD